MSKILYMTNTQMRKCKSTLLNVITYFTIIPDSLLEVLAPLLLGNMSNILTLPDFYRKCLFVSKHTIWCENEKYPRVLLVTVCVSLFYLFRWGNIISYTK